MRQSKMRKLLCTSIPVCLFLISVPLWACSVPVFRYALERWAADPYLVVVFHRGELTQDQQELVKRLGPKGETAEKSANLKVRAVNIDTETDEAMLELWKLQDTDTLPWMAVHYPGPFPPAWKGEFSKEVVDGLIDSPVRREIARRILKGETAVWVLLEGNNKEKNDAAFKLLKQRINHEQKTLKLPEIDPEDIAQGLISPDAIELKLGFSAIRLSRDHAREKLFIDMLLGSEGGGEFNLRDENADKPMAFPIYGRGRVLYALVGDGINQDTIADACKFLIGPCTCQIKGDNPGIDLVMAVDWDSLVEPQVEIDKELPPLAGLGAFAVAPSNSTEPNKTHPTSAESDSEEVESDSSIDEFVVEVEVTIMNPVMRNTLLFAGLILIVVVGASFFLARRS